MHEMQNQQRRLMIDSPDGCVQLDSEPWFSPIYSGCGCSPMRKPYPMRGIGVVLRPCHRRKKTIRRMPYGFLWLG